MRISTVKNNMYQSYSVCGILENNLSQLISILNVVDGSTANKVSSYIASIEHTISNVEMLFKKMYQLNRVELHIFFSELNSKNREMISKIAMLKKYMDFLKKASIEKYELYRYYAGMEFLANYNLHMVLISSIDLKRYIPILNNLKNDIQLFKLMIDTNNNKLRIGVRK